MVTRIGMGLRWLLAAAFSALVACGPPPAVEQEQAVLAYPPPPDEPKLFYERTLRGSTDVDTEAESAAMRALITGEQQTGGRMLGKPFGVAAHGGRVYVSDTINRSVMMFDPATATVKEIGREEPGVLAKPMGLDTDDQGNLYVVDATSKWVNIYDRDGKYLDSVGGKEMFSRPGSVAVSPDGSKIYVVDTGGSRGDAESHRIRVFDNNGTHLMDIGKRGSEDGEFNLPKDAAVGRDGMLYVVDSGNFRIQVFDTNGRFVRAFGKVGRRLGQFARPKGVALSPDGNVYVSDASHANFQIFNPMGQLLLFVGERGQINDTAKYILPSDIAVDEDGRVYMVDQVMGKVDIFRPAHLKEDEGLLGRAFKAMAGLKEAGKEPTKPQAVEPKAEPKK